jgi:hypothetical protein
MNARRNQPHFLLPLRPIYSPINNALMKRPLSRTQSVFIVLLWLALCFIVLVSTPRIDGPVVVTLAISAALVFIPVIKSLKQRR